MNKLQTIHIGLDDTDSTKGGCTTYLAANLVEEFEKLKVKFIDYPGLIRLNPNIPWKTRGNGALCLRFMCDGACEDQIKDVALKLWEKHSALHEKGTDPGIVFYNNSEIPAQLRAFSQKAETNIVTLKEAKDLSKELGVEATGFNSCRGIIGALAAIGEILNGDFTYELIAYRRKENLGTRRLVDTASIYEMDRLTNPHTFNNVDLEKKRVIITPRGPDPILFGIRGESAEIVKKALKLIKSLEPIERWTIFRSNQGTDSHLKPVKSISFIKPYSSVIVKGEVSKDPKNIPLRHIIFPIKDDSAIIDCAAYEPTGSLRKIARELVVGDNIEAYGSVHKAIPSKPLTINLEKIKVLSLLRKTTVENPLCPNCEKHLESMGKNQGLRCKKCGRKFENLEKKVALVQRGLTEGLYVTSTRSQRHLTKPLRRYGQEKSSVQKIIMIEEWHSSFN